MYHVDIVLYQVCGLAEYPIYYLNSLFLSTTSSGVTIVYMGQKDQDGYNAE